MVWLLATLIALIGAWIAYGPLWRAPSPERGSLADELSRPVTPTRSSSLALGALRAGAYLCLIAMLLGAPSGTREPLAPLAVLDASHSWMRGGSNTLWRAAMDSMRAVGGDSVLLFGDSARIVSRGDVNETFAQDHRSLLQPVLDQATALGRAVAVITDAELDDPAALLRLPAGSRVVRLERPRAVDAAVAQLEVPSFATGGDSIVVSAKIVAGNDSVRSAVFVVLLNNAELARTPVRVLEPFASQQQELRVVLPRGDGERELSAVVVASGDNIPHNDTLSSIIDVSDRPRVVFVSTSPDLDVREALRVLRGSVKLPVRGYLRVAPGIWREEGTLAAVSEADVQSRAGAAGLLVLHGDSLWNGVVAARRGPVVIWSPAPAPAATRPGEIARQVEWYVSRVPASPISSAIAALPLDSLPPLDVGGAIGGGVSVLEARAGRAGEPRVIAAVSTESGPRRLRISGSGYASWALRGGRAADAFTALWGAMFDWMAASQTDGATASLAANVVRSGEPLRWRRGGTDSVVSVAITSATGGVDSVSLTFSSTQDVVETAALPEGRYTIGTGETVRRLIVNPSREWVPRSPAPAPQISAAGAPAMTARSLIERTWPFVLALLLLSGEWLLRRRVGLR